MMYMPLLRGRYQELRLLGNKTQLIRNPSILPIIEPVSLRSGDLERLVQCFALTNMPMGLIVNPSVGELKSTPHGLQDRLSKLMRDGSAVFPVVRTGQAKAPEQMLRSFKKFALLQDSPLGPENAIVRAGRPSRLCFHILDIDKVPDWDEQQLLAPTILLRDGFVRRRSVDYPADEAFHSGPGRLNLSGMLGWSDYSIAGAQFQTGGGRPYAVAIHILYWDAAGALRVLHFKSDSNDGPQDPGGKFGEALEKLIQCLDCGDYAIPETEAILRFRELHSRGRFPGLPTLKRLSIWHHLETIDRWLEGRFPS